MANEQSFESVNGKSFKHKRSLFKEKEKGQRSKLSVTVYDQEKRVDGPTRRSICLAPFFGNPIGPSLFSKDSGFW